MTVWQIVFGLREDLELDSRWWHRLAKVTCLLVVLLSVLWFGFTVPAELPSGKGNERIVETLSSYVKARPDDADPVASFTKKYQYRSGKKESDGSVSFAFFETSMYCAVRPYEHTAEFARYLRPRNGQQPTPEDGLAVLRRLEVSEHDPKGYTCVALDANVPHPDDLVGWEYTFRAQVIGNAEKYGIALVVLSAFWYSS